ncbi:YgcG family protein [Zoogloea sp.]|uniref:TPM domain-containing protein n=1 Tax=Zoogloea sp. TaxID=49181 RepID=UPI0035AFA2DB
MATSVPELTGRVTDESGLMPAGNKAALESKLEKLAKERGLQIGVVLIASPQPYTLDVYWGRAVTAWRNRYTGGKDGVLLLIAKNDGRIFVDIGQGPSEKAYRDAMGVAVDVMAPLLRKGDYAAGLDTGINALTVAFEAAGRSQQQQQTADTPVPMPLLSVADHRWLLALVVVVLVVRRLGMITGRMLAGALGGGAVFVLAWELTALAWVGAVCAGFVALFALGGSPGNSMKVIGRSTGGSAGTTGASGDWLR